MIDHHAIYEMWSVVTLWALSLFAIFFLVLKALPSKFQSRKLSRIMIFICLGYYVWWIADVVAVYSYGRASLPLRTFICLLVVKPADSETLLAEVPLVLERTNYVVQVRHKYEGEYILGVKTKNSRVARELNVPVGAVYGCFFSFAGLDGTRIFSDSFSATDVLGRRRLVTSYYVGGTDGVVPTRKILTLQVSFVGDIATFLRDNPDSYLFLSARGGL